VVSGKAQGAGKGVTFIEVERVVILELFENLEDKINVLGIVVGLSLDSTTYIQQAFLDELEISIFVVCERILEPGDLLYSIRFRDGGLVVWDDLQHSLFSPKIGSE
jgi:hypothetical protein